MPSTAVRVVDLYPYRLLPDGSAEFLLLRRAATVVYGRQWRMVGGKIQPEEAAWQAALRELEEETGRRPVTAWCVPSVNAFYEWRHDRINLAPAFAAQLDADPVLNREHDAFCWLPAEKAARRLAWPEQQRLLRLVDACLRQGLAPEWRLPGVRGEAGGI